MTSVAPPVIAFELGVGEFRIVTPEAVYQIKVCHDLVEAAPGEAPLARIDDASPFFKEISEELFEQVGRLTRNLSVSLEDLPRKIMSADNLDQAEGKLENAKGQLQEIVKITEQASMSIMDTADMIQSDMDELTKQLESLNDLDMVACCPAPDSEGEEAAGAPPASAGGQPPARQDFLNKLAELKAFVAKLSGSSEAPAAAQEPPPPARSGPGAFRPARPLRRHPFRCGCGVPNPVRALHQ